MDIFQFMSESPVLTFTIVYMVTVTFPKSWSRFIRHLNIRKHGWPPPHCDADGDFKEVEEPESPNQ